MLNKKQQRQDLKKKKKNKQHVEHPSTHVSYQIS